jgi:Flp pilus assembly protein TadD
VLRIYPTFSLAYLFRGSCYAFIEDAKLALQDLWRAEALGVNTPLLHGSLGLAYDLAGDYANALQAYRQYVEMESGDPQPAILDRIAELEAITQG